MVTVSVDEIEDETEYVQWGNTYDQQFMSIKMEVNQKSSWVVYPDRFKFFSIHLLLDPDIKTTERNTYSFFAFVGDIGGLTEFLLGFFGYLAKPFAMMRMKALLTNRLHHVT
jgi:hypothetical protein